MIEKISKHSLLIYAYITFMNFAYLNYYYTEFGLTIYNFLDPSEIITLVLNQSNILLLNLFIILIVITPNIFLSQIDITSVSNFIYTKSKRSYKDYLKILPFLIAIFLLLYTLINAIIAIYFDFINHKFETIVLYKAIFFIIVCILMYPSFLKIFIKNNISIDIELYNLVFVTVLVYNSISSIAKINHYYKLNKKHVELISFEYENTNISSNDSIIYIGMTNQFIFLHDIKKSKNFIYEKEKISGLNLTLLSKN